jgi:hypothetical protein
MIQKWKRVMYILVLTGLVLAGLMTGCGPEGGRLSLEAAQKRILTFLRAQNPDLAEDVQLSLKERTTDEIWDALKVQVFQNQSDPFLNQAFLVTEDKKVIPMGESFGDAGVTDLLLADLNKDEQLELVFTYSFGSGLIWSHIAVYVPRMDREGILVSDLAYKGRLSLEKKSTRLVNVRVCGIAAGAEELNCPDILGFLTLIVKDESGSLGVSLAPNLPPAITENIAYME